ncbi:MAG TPA: porin [Desulfuromonadaceae bacterium]|jgi:hypothetical protein
MKKSCIITVLAASVFAIGASGHAATIEDLQKQLDNLNGKIQELQTQKVGETTRENSGYMKKVWDKTTIGGYGELDYIFKRDNGNDNGGNTLNPHRVVLYVGSELADWVSLNTELEWENGGSDGQNGGVAVEQAYLDFKLNEMFNIKAGVMLMPMGAYNQAHEPTNFYSTARPALDTFLIPSTWQEMGIGAHGTLGRKVDYQLMAVAGLDGTKFDAENGIREGRQAFGKDSNRNFAVTGRLDYHPITNLSTAVSFYSGNSAPSGTATAYTTVMAFDGKYRYSDFEIAGEYVHVYQDKPELLNPEIGRNMSGYWVEGAWHCMPKMLKNGKLANADSILFARYSELTTQDGGAIDSTKTSGRFDRNYTTVGLSFMPIPAVAIKADYQFFGDHRAAGEIPLDNDKFQLTVGFVF